MMIDKVGIVRLMLYWIHTVCSHALKESARYLSRFRVQYIYAYVGRRDKEVFYL